MEYGVIFDIKEFAVNDGPGVRQTVFLKGCPLRCNWCHNPEGWERSPQALRRPKDCIRCGACERVCTTHPCSACGDCVRACPTRARWICGERLSAKELVGRLERNTALYAGMGGGVTFSGGEPLDQSAFLFETSELLGRGVHQALETCGYAGEAEFREALSRFDLILMDVKLVDDALHQRYTGKSNGPILRNLSALCRGSTPFIIRIPLIPGVTDTQENLEGAARLLRGAPALRHVELLPYNRLAGVKYEWMDLPYQPQFDTERPVMFRHNIFRQYHIESVGR